MRLSTALVLLLASASCITLNAEDMSPVTEASSSRDVASMSKQLDGSDESGWLDGFLDWMESGYNAGRQLLRRRRGGGGKDSLTFVGIGDFGREGDAAQAVADMVKDWRDEIDHIVTLGDNNYPDGEWETMEKNVGQYYGRFIHNSKTRNKFWPCTGNHDWNKDDISPYFRYFKAIDSQRYYERKFYPGNDRRKDPLVHFFCLNSDPVEAGMDGNTKKSKQARWLKRELDRSDAEWKIVAFHHPPYSSGDHGNNPWMQWPFEEWGAHVVLAGHDHNYERLHFFHRKNDDCKRSLVPYFVNGASGTKLRTMMKIQDESQLHLLEFGAQKFVATKKELQFEFWKVDPVTGDYRLADCLTMEKDRDRRCGERVTGKLCGGRKLRRRLERAAENKGEL